MEVNGITFYNILHSDAAKALKLVETISSTISFCITHV